MTEMPDTLAVARQIGYELARSAIWDGPSCNWLGWQTNPGTGLVATYTWRSLGPSLYDGTAGIGWFLVDLACETGEPLFHHTALGAIRHALAHTDDGQQPQSLSVFSGSLGVAMTALKAGYHLSFAEFAQAGWQRIMQLAGLRGMDCQADVISGISGAILCLLGLASSQPPGGQADWLLDLVQDQVKNLVAKSAVRTVDDSLENDRERYWPEESFSPGGLTGYSHGNAGMLNALLEVAERFDDSTYRQYADECLTFERRRFHTKLRNWLDLRQFDLQSSNSESGRTAEEPSRGISAIEGGPLAPDNNVDTGVASLAWCHGAPGIGLGRIRTLQLRPDDPQVVQEIQQAIDSTERGLDVPAEQIHNYCLCHGALGNCELLWSVRDLRLPLRITDSLLNRRMEELVMRSKFPHLPWRCGTQDARSTPGLMLGIAGIGSACLRAHDHSNRLPLLLTPEFGRYVATRRSEPRESRQSPRAVPNTLPIN